MTLGLMIAAPKSGSGKTTVTLGLLRALARRGLRVASLKCGPDYIDPAFHTVATGRTSMNLDSWTMPKNVMDGIVARGAKDADIVIVEGSMGLFDGVATVGASGDGASADVAAMYGFPVVLVMDTSGQSQSAGATALGFSTFHPDVKIAGVIGNVASERHRMLAAKGVQRADIQVIGQLPRGAVPPIPERHLGLVQAQELPDVSKMVDALADSAEKHIDLDILLKLATKIHVPAHDFVPALAAPGKRIALARDAAFSFMYGHVLAGWEAQGAQILPFSPLADEVPDNSADCCWLPGGYPELHAATLAGNRNFLHDLRDFANTRPVHGECGGYMVLGKSITDASGTEHAMSALLPLKTSFAARKLHLGYRAVTLACDTPIGKTGAMIRGHEFHYATITQQGNAQSLGEATDANGTSLGAAGMRVGFVTGTFFHAVAHNG